jgi:hypothetical protein
MCKLDSLSMSLTGMICLYEFVFLVTWYKTAHSSQNLTDTWHTERVYVDLYPKVVRIISWPGYQLLWLAFHVVFSVFPRNIWILFEIGFKYLLSFMYLLL